MCRRNLFHNNLQVCTELQVLSKTASRLWFYAYKKYKNGNSARRTASKRHIRPVICSGGSDNFSSGISGKIPKKQHQTSFFLRTADRIAAKFCTTIKKIKPNDIFQNCVHSCFDSRHCFSERIINRIIHLKCIFSDHLKLFSDLTWSLG